MKKLILCSLITFNTLTAQVAQQWVSTFNGPSNRADAPTSMVIDAAGNVYVTGRTDNDPTGNSNYDVMTIGYDKALYQVS